MKLKIKMNKCWYRSYATNTPFEMKVFKLNAIAKKSQFNNEADIDFSYRYNQYTGQFFSKWLKHRWG